MISVPGAEDPLLVSVKAVDPSAYPYYGQIRLQPAARLRDVLTPETVVVSEDLLVRLGAPVGESIRLGEHLYRLAGVVTMEPDRMTGSLNVGPRLMMSREGLERSGIMVPGSRASQRFLFRLPAEGPRVQEVRAVLREAFPSGLIADFTQTHPLITRGLNRATTFLTLVSLISLIVGALGVATAMHSHLRQRMDSIAVMKCLGARSSQIMRIYVLQTLLLGVGGSALGVAFGLAVQAAFPSLIARYFPVAPGLRIDWLSSLQGLAAGVLTTLLFTWPPLAAIRNVRPGLILRRDMPEARPPLAQRLRDSRGALAAGAVVALGIAMVAATLADSARLGAWFAGGLVVSLVVLAAFGKALLSALKYVVKRARPSPAVSHGLANLYRPGNQAPFVVAALGVGVMFTLTIFLVQGSMLNEIFRSAPPGMPNVFLINITDRERAGLLKLLEKQPGVESPPEVVAAVPARLLSVNGTPTEKLPPGPARRFLRTRQITWAAEKPEHTEVVSGAWWNPAAVKETLVSVEDDTAESLNVAPGGKLQFTSAGRTISATVASIHRTESVRPGSSIDFIFTPGSLEGLPAIYFGGMRVRARDVPALQRAAYRLYPTVTVINAADVLAIIQDVVDQIALVVRFVSFFAVAAGAIVLASSIAGTRLRRMREVAILKALGATRKRVAAILAIELIVLGAVAGTMGSLLASGFSALLLNRFFDASFRFDPLPNLAAIACTALLATAAGWLAGHRFLAQKPLEALRHE
jgi:putative ABC transport system permease protein